MAATPPLLARATQSRLLATTRATLRLVWRASPPLTLTLALLTLLSAEFPVAIAYAGKRIVDAVVAAGRADTLRWVLVELALVAGFAVAQRALQLLYTVLGARLGIEVNLILMHKALSLELSHFESSEFYDRLTRAKRDAPQRPLQLVANLFALVQSVLTIAGCLALLMRFSGWAALVLFVATVPAALAEIRYSRLTYGLRNQQSPGTRRLNYIEHVLTNDEHAKEVRIFGLGALLLGRYRTQAESFFRAERNLAVRHALVAQLVALLSTGAFYGAYALMAVAAAVGRLTLGNMTMYVVAFRQGQQAFQAMLGTIGFIYEHSLYMANLFEFLAIEPPPARPALAPVALSVPRGIQFIDVGFRYPTSGRWALRHIDLQLAEGDSLALVGENGAGKSTLVKLLTRLYEPTEGRILLDGRDLASWDRQALMARFSVVFQDFNQYQLTLKESVALGSVAHLHDEARVRRALDRSGCNELATTLRGGLETQLGGWFDDGSELSGGQWQRIAIARAFMREEADIVILDEPTASLDARAEHALFERFRELSRGRTTLVISHRFATARMANRIVVLEQGHILEKGSHSELVASGGAYSKLFTLQAEGYR